jgi:hypothetical protein
MPRKIDDVSRLYLLQILEVLRLQQEKIQDFFVKIQALESILTANPPSLAEYLGTIESLNTPEQRRAFANGLAHIDEMIQALREPSVEKPN